MWGLAPFRGTASGEKAWKRVFILFLTLALQGRGFGGLADEAERDFFLYVFENVGWNIFLIAKELVILQAITILRRLPPPNNFVKF